MALRGPRDTADCAQCHKELVISEHLASPSKNVPVSRIHRVSQPAIGSAFTIFCPICKHYTTYS
jgi:hypothetical protein